jgi:zinc transport system substrate-binding protein
MKKLWVAIIGLMLAFSLSACFNSPTSNNIYVTVYPLKYLADEILQGTGYTVGIVPGVSSHENSVDWSPKDIISMTNATYLFYVGANYDQYIDFQIDSIFTNKNVELVKIEDETNYIQFIPGLVHSYDSNNQEVIVDDNLGSDPHFWVSPQKMIQVSELIRDKLAVKFNSSVDLMENNYEVLLGKLQALSNAFTNVISNQQKPIMTATNIYGYLYQDYGLNFFSISPGYHEETEQFTGQQKEAIVTEAINNDINYVLYERNTTSPLSNAVFTELENLGRTPVKLEYDILQSLTNDEISQGENYITVMYDNLNLLKLATDYVGG